MDFVKTSTINETVFGNDVTDTPNTTYTTGLDIPTLARSHYFFKVSMAVNNYYGLFIIVCGVIGNTLSFLIMVQVSWLKVFTLFFGISNIFFIEEIGFDLPKIFWNP